MREPDTPPKSQPQKAGASKLADIGARLFIVAVIALVFWLVRIKFG